MLGLCLSWFLLESTFSMSACWAPYFLHVCSDVSFSRKAALDHYVYEWPLPVELSHHLLYSTVILPDILCNLLSIMLSPTVMSDTLCNLAFILLSPTVMSGAGGIEGAGLTHPK